MDGLGGGDATSSNNKRRPKKPQPPSIAKNCVQNPSSRNLPVNDQPIADLISHYNHLKKKVQFNGKNYSGFDLEFNYIENRTKREDLMQNYESASANVNKNKNRYMNVLPPEKTRVKLSVLEGIEGSDYINANFISVGLSEPQKRYISTQGPLRNTVCDFWRMIWEHNCAIIVMLTNMFENGQEKCTEYWPSKEHLTISFNILNVTLNKTECIATGLYLRRLTLTKDGFSRCVTHFQYTVWPDHGLPTEGIDTFLKLVRLVNDENHSSNQYPRPPICVHCSAGIGRTGTFCTVNNVLQHINQEVEKSRTIPPVSILNTVLDLRRQRPGMVQTKEQYYFCYKAILREYKFIKSHLSHQAKNPRVRNNDPQ
eukprot:TRINITY_DN7971_c0_g1_i1.p1 TRINITY_DN7971_c0_g1~~TRINITY_DN7971_c0_g1_i1.p1  ORF type:complete len:369 (-),score=30.44 TRINITY_DN7971_c0_g1_i1:6-1112(-)